EESRLPRRELAIHVIRPRSLVTEVHEAVGVLDVEGLVEDEGVRVPEVPESEDRRHEEHGEWAAPIPEPLPERSPEDPRPPGVEPSATGLGGVGLRDRGVVIR